MPQPIDFSQIRAECSQHARHGHVATETAITIQEVLEQLRGAEPPGHASPGELGSRTSEASSREKPQKWTRPDSVAPALKASQG